MAHAKGYVYGARQITRRPHVMGLRGAVSSSHYLASEAGMRVLHRGGNAIDAGVAAGLCINVLLPYLTSLGGVAPIILYSAAERSVSTISGLGRWPRGASIDVMHERGRGEIPRGILRCVTPAALDAWVLALSRHGRLTFAEVAAPALELAERGFPVDRSLATALAAHELSVADWPGTLAAFYARGRSPRLGEVLVQNDLAFTLKALMAAEGSAVGNRKGKLQAVRDLFYKGELGRRIAKFSLEEDGLLTAEDLASFAVTEDPAVCANYKGYQVYACGPWSQGPSVPQALKLLEGFDLRAMGHNSPAYLHHIVEAIKLTFADRERFYGDPDFVDVPLDALLSDNYAQRRRSLLDPDRAWPEMPPHGNPRKGEARRSSPPPITASPQFEGDTSYVCSVDGEGNAFSATPSDFIGDVPVVPGLGLIISGRGSQSWLDPEHPSSLQPWKRPRLTPNPGLVMLDGDPYLAFGTPGGDQQPQAMVQAFLSIVEFDMAPQEAVEAPRVGSESFPNSFWPHIYNPGRLNVESTLAASSRLALGRLGHDVKSWGHWQPEAGHLCAILRDPHSRVLYAAADPRFNSYAIAW